MQKSDFEALEAALRIDEHALEEALAQQGELYYRVAKAHAMALSQRDAAKQALADAEADAEARVRHDAEVAGEKITNPEVASQARRSKEVQEAITVLLRAGRFLNKYTALKDAYEMRGRALTPLASLYLKNYYSSDSPNAEQRMVMANAARAAQATRRRSRDG